MNKNRLLIVTFLISFCSMCYELLIADSLAIMTGSHIYWQAITMGIYIAGMGFGTNKVYSLNDDQSFDEFSRTEFILSILGSLSLLGIIFFKCFHIIAENNVLIRSSSDLDYEKYSQMYKILFLIGAQLLTFLIGYFTGKEVPLMIQLGKHQDKEWTNLILGVNYMGTLLGSVLVMTLLIPKLGIIYTAVLISCFNFSIFIYMNIINKSSIKKSRVLIFLLLTTLLVGTHDDIEQLYLKVKYYHFDFANNLKEKKPILEFLTSLPDREDVDRKRSLYQYIDRYEVPQEDGTFGIELSLDEHFQFTKESEKLYHEGMAHIPIMVNRKVPKNILVLGAGDGLLTRELLRYSKTKITQVELDKEIVTISNEDPRISALNEFSMKDKRVEMLNTDGFYFIRNTKEKYDAIYIDFPYPNNFNIIKLFSYEFYKYVIDSLSDDGFIVVGLPISMNNGSYDFTPKSKRNNDIFFSTFYYSGFKELIPFAVDNHTFMMASTKKKSREYLKSLLPTEFISLTPDYLRVFRQKFPHEMQKSKVNSIFKPILVKEI